MLGLESKKVLLVEYDQGWISFYESEAKVIEDALGDSATDIQHIGSTSVVGLRAKPIIDVLIGLQTFDKMDEIFNKMKGLCYTYAHWAGIPGDYTRARELSEKVILSRPIWFMLWNMERIIGIIIFDSVIPSEITRF